MTLDRLQADLRAALKRIDEVLDAAKSEDRQLTEDENTEVEKLTAENENRVDDIEGLKRAAEFRKKRDAAQQADEWLVGARSFNDTETGLEDRRSYHTWPVEEAGQFFAAIREHENGAVPSDMHPDLRDTFVSAIEKRAPTGQGTLFDSEGGFLIPTTISRTILQKVHGEGRLVSRVQNVPITVGNSTKWNAVQENSRVSGQRYGGITVARTAEAKAITDSQAEFEQIQLELRKLAALVYMSDEQLEDGPQVMTVVNDLVPRAITFKIEDEIINGDAASQMEGVLNMAALVSVTKETGQAAATVLFDNIVKMYARLHAASIGSVVWLINQDILPQLFTMSMPVGTGGVPVYLPASGAAGAPFGSLMGRPVIPIEHCATLGTVGDILLVDLGQYLYATKGGVRTAQSIHVKFTQDETAFRFVLRNDGRSWWPAALTPAKGSNTQSPFVALATRS